MTVSDCLGNLISQLLLCILNVCKLDFKTRLIVLGGITTSELLLEVEHICSLLVSGSETLAENAG